MLWQQLNTKTGQEETAHKLSLRKESWFCADNVDFMFLIIIIIII